MIQVRLCRILISETSEQQMIWLKEVGGGRSFPIVIGFFEAAAIDRTIKAIRTPRPLTHDLLQRVIQDLGGEVERVEIHDLRESTFFARIVVRQEADEIEIDARPSDAIALAIGAEAPILVAEHVLADAAAAS